MNPDVLLPVSWLDLAEQGDGDWRERALCAQTDPEAFFPDKGDSTQEAKRICLGCEVRAECLEYALASDERFGIWGGMSALERRAARRRKGPRRPNDITAAEAAHIRRLADSGLPTPAIAERVGRSSNVVDRIRNGRDNHQRRSA